MNGIVNIDLNRDLSALLDLPAGTAVSLSGEIFTLRDAGHKRLVESYQAGQPDFDVKNKAIYYCGPTPACPGEVIGSCGPTTATRMDSYTPYLLDRGLKVMIGKGQRSDAVIAAMIENGAVYLAAVGGAGALYKRAVVKNEPVLYPDLGCEAMRKLTVKNMPLLVAIDRKGNTILK